MDFSSQFRHNIFKCVDPTNDSQPSQLCQASTECGGDLQIRKHDHHSISSARTITAAVSSRPSAEVFGVDHEVEPPWLLDDREVALAVVASGVSIFLAIMRKVSKRFTGTPRVLSLSNDGSRILSRLPTWYAASPRGTIFHGFMQSTTWKPCLSSN